MSRNIRIQTLAVLIALGLSGCPRFGNNIVGPPSNDPFTGLYEVAPQDLKFFTNAVGAAAPRWTASSLDHTPSYLAGIMSNPAVLEMFNLETGEGALYAAFGGSSAWPVTVSGTSVALQGSDSIVTLFTDPNCQTQLYVTLDGKIDSSITTVIQGYRTRGRLGGTAEVSRAWAGPACAAELAAMRECYVNLNQCPGSSTQTRTTHQQRVHSLFDAYLNANIFTIDDLPQFDTVGYRATYQ